MVDSRRTACTVLPGPIFSYCTAERVHCIPCRLQFLGCAATPNRLRQPVLQARLCVHHIACPSFSLVQGLGLERYQATFEQQEIDLAIVHAITADELASIGVTDQLHQVRGLADRGARAARGRAGRGGVGWGNIGKGCSHICQGSWEW